MDKELEKKRDRMADQWAKEHVPDEDGFSAGFNACYELMIKKPIPFGFAAYSEDQHLRLQKKIADENLATAIEALEYVSRNRDPVVNDKVALGECCDVADKALEKINEKT